MFKNNCAISGSDTEEINSGHERYVIPQLWLTGRLWDLIIALVSIFFHATSCNIASHCMGGVQGKKVVVDLYTLQKGSLRTFQPTKITPVAFSTSK